MWTTIARTVITRPSWAAGVLQRLSIDQLNAVALQSARGTTPDVIGDFHRAFAGRSQLLAQTAARGQIEVRGIFRIPKVHLLSVGIPRVSFSRNAFPRHLLGHMHV